MLGKIYLLCEINHTILDTAKAKPRFVKNCVYYRSVGSITNTGGDWARTPPRLVTAKGWTGQA